LSEYKGLLFVAHIVANYNPIIAIIMLFMADRIIESSIELFGVLIFAIALFAFARAVNLQYP
jgi:hypothetical protein